MSKGSPLAVCLPWNCSQYQDPVPALYTLDFELLGLCVLCLPVSMTGGCVTLAASRLLGPDAAPAPRLATNKSTARLSAKRRRIQLPSHRGKSFSGRVLLRSDDQSFDVLLRSDDQSFDAS